MRVAIIGGGPAGFFSAISAATHDSSAEIILFEATRRPLGKVYLSGGGRCNVSNHCFDPAELVKYYPRGNKELLGPFSRFQPRDVADWFEKHGVNLKVEDDGRMFPATDKSSTIVDCLLKTSAESGIQVRLGAKVKNIGIAAGEGKSSLFEIESADGVCEYYDRVMLATGSSPMGHHFAETLGHTIAPCVPSLFTFKVSDARLDGLAGISFENARLTLAVNDNDRLEQSGGLLITHWGLSGPAVLKLSAWGARILHENSYRATLGINFLPNYSVKQLQLRLLEHKERYGRKQVGGDTVLPVPKRYWTRILQHIGIPEETTWANMTKKAMTSIISELTGGQFAISGKGIFKEEFVTCGGINLKEVDFKTMQSKQCPGLYFAGEILDIDGITGGFNFQSAWTTGWIGGLSMVS